MWKRSWKYSNFWYFWSILESYREGSHIWVLRTLTWPILLADLCPSSYYTVVQRSISVISGGQRYQQSSICNFSFFLTGGQRYQQSRGTQDWLTTAAVSSKLLLQLVFYHCLKNGISKPSLINVFSLYVITMFTPDQGDQGYTNNRHIVSLVDDPFPPGGFEF